MAGAAASFVLCSFDGMFRFHERNLSEREEGKGRGEGAGERERERERGDGQTMGERARTPYGLILPFLLLLLLLLLLLVFLLHERMLRDLHVRNYKGSEVRKFGVVPNK
jgi:hypothetical protein